MFEQHHPFGLGDEDVGGNALATKVLHNSTIGSTLAPSERPGTGSVSGSSRSGMVGSYYDMKDELSDCLLAMDKKLDQLTTKVDKCLEAVQTQPMRRPSLPSCILRSAAAPDPESSPTSPPAPLTAPAPLPTPSMAPSSMLNSPANNPYRFQQTMTGIISIPSGRLEASPTSSEKSAKIMRRSIPGTTTKIFSGTSSRPEMPLAYRNNIIARRMYEKSSSKNLDHIAKRMKELPQAVSCERNARVQAVFEFLEDPTYNRWAYIFSTCTQIIVMLSVFVTFLQTLEEPILYGVFAAVLETIFDCLFAMEVGLRFAVCPSRWSFLCMAYSWFDIVAALPLILRASIGFVLSSENEDSVHRTILWSVVPILRLLKILRHFETFRLLVNAVKLTLEALPMLLYSVVLVTMCFATLIYIVEPRDNIESPSRAVWFCIVTVTTVGYGDITPKTGPGYVIVMIMIFVGVILTSVPIGIIGNAFNQVWEARHYTLLVSRTQNAMRKWGYTAHDIPRLFRLADSDGNGVLELDEFSELVKEMKIGLSQDRIIALFEHLDKDGSGALDSMEFAVEIFPATFIDAYGHQSSNAAAGETSDTATCD